MSDCIFCKIIRKEIPSETIDEDERTMVFLDIHPVCAGHALVVPKTHAADLLRGETEDALAVMRTICRVAPVLLRVVGAEGWNLGMNAGVSAGQDVFHTHLHLMPRKFGEPRSFVARDASPKELRAVADRARQEIARL